MITRPFCMVAAIALFSLAHADEKKLDEAGSPPKPLRGAYQVYGGTLSEMMPPTTKDRKVAFVFKGPLAKDLFSQIGPDAKQACTVAPDYHERRRGDLVCIHDENGYNCYLGLDVPTGKSTYGVIC